MHAGLIGFGWLGVQLFFVLSGYLITRTLLADHVKIASFGDTLKLFYLKRALRIFPIYYLFLGYFAVVYAVRELPKAVPLQMPYALTYTYNFAAVFKWCKYSPIFTHLWSLSVEEQFYLIWPLCVLLLYPLGRLKSLIVACILLAPIFRAALGYFLVQHPNEALTSVGRVIYCLPLSHFDAFAWGALLNFVRLPTHHRVTQYTMLLLALFIAAGVANCYLRPSPIPFLSSLGYPLHGAGNGQYIWSYTLANALFAALLAWIITLERDSIYTTLRKILYTPVLLWIGKISYGIYLFHWVIMNGIFMLTHTKNPPLDFLATLILTTLFASGVYLLIERPILRYKDTLSNHYKTRKPSP